MLSAATDGELVSDRPNGDVVTIQESLGMCRWPAVLLSGEIGPIGEELLHGHTASIALIRSRPATPERT